MKEYITKDRAKQFVCGHCNEVCSEEPCEPSDCDWMAFIDKEPAADVAPVRHGRWIDSGDYVTTAYGSLPVKMCSECHMDVTLDDFDNYCTHCGAKMDVEEVCKENTKNT